jgi:cell fate regulator YaaT (PSP1 superfamily)
MADEKKEVVGVRFQRAGKMYYFDSAGIELAINDRVVVDTVMGPEMGNVVIAPKQVLLNEMPKPLKRVLRKASSEDIKHDGELRAKREDILSRSREIAIRMGLRMKFLNAEYNLDCTRLTISFSAEGRIDFRDLVRELAATFKTRVELRQVGPRDEAKLVGDIGRCGRPLCCTTFLTEFNPLSIKMAKEQSLSLNPINISGVCGRLLCCLRYENELYHLMREKMPEMEQRVTTPLGIGKVTGLNLLRETVTVQLDTEATKEFLLSEIVTEGKQKQRQRGGEKEK